MSKKKSSEEMMEEEVFEIIEHMCDDLDILIRAYEVIEEFYADELHQDLADEAVEPIVFH